MRRIAYLLLLFAFCLPSNVEADSVSNVDITLNAINPGKGLGGRPRTPAMPITALQSDHVFTFTECLAGETIEIVSGDTVVYTSVIGEDGTVQVPDNLTGEFTLVLYLGDKTYSAEVEL